MAIYKLEEICDIKRGSSPRPIKKWLTNSSGLMWAKISDINDNKIMNTKEWVDLSWKNNALLGSYKDLFITNSATPGVAFIQKNKNFIAYHDGFLKIVPNEKFILKKYLLYKLINDRYKLIKMGNGAIFINLSSKILKNWQIKLISLKTQKQIIDIIEPIEKLELTIKKLSKVIGFITKNTFITFSEKNDYNFQKGLLPIKNKVGITPFLNVSAANNKINRYVINEPNIKIGDVTISLDGNTGLVNNALEGFNGYLFKVTSKKWKNYQIYYSLKNKINQKIIKLNEIGTTIKHSSKSKKEILHLEFLEDFLLKEMFNLEISIFKIVKKLKKLKKFLINLLIN